MTTNISKTARTVAILNLFAGMGIAIVLLVAIASGISGQFIIAGWLFLLCIIAMSYRIYRVFKFIN